jgi:hypothetical protein
VYISPIKFVFSLPLLCFPPTCSYRMFSLPSLSTWRIYSFRFFCLNVCFFILSFLLTFPFFPKLLASLFPLMHHLSILPNFYPFSFPLVSFFLLCLSGFRSYIPTFTIPSTFLCNIPFNGVWLHPHKTDYCHDRH